MEIIDVGGETTAERILSTRRARGQRTRHAPERTAFPNDQRLDLDGFIGRARSASYVPKTGPAGDRLLALLRSLHARYAAADGTVALVYETEVSLSNKV